MTFVFPCAMMVASAGASIVYLIDADWRRAIYWAAATVITASVTL